MRRLAALAVLSLWACEQPTAADPVRVTRQAGATLPSMPHVVGRVSGARLGASVAGCRFPGFVAGAPGEGVAVLRRADGGATWYGLPYNSSTGDAGSVGFVSGCEGSDAVAQVLTGGNDGLWHFPVPGTIAGPGAALATNPVATTPRLLIGERGLSAVWSRVFDSTQGWLNPTPGITVGGAFGTAVAWHPNGVRFAASDPTSGLVRQFDATSWDSSTPTAPLELDGGTIAGPASGGFGGALLFGDVHPRAGVELVVADTTSRTVFVYGAGDGGQALLMKLGPLSGSSGAGLPMPLLLQPRSLLTDGVLQALWVGVPEENVVYRFIGDAGDTLDPGPVMQFGYSLGSTSGTMLIGAPDYADGTGETVGGVYGLPFDTSVIDGGVAMECDVTAPCKTQRCERGVCVGGVICVLDPGPTCASAQCIAGACVSVGFDGGVLDAGVLDAGVFDAGVLDAGSPDAGEVDAGTPDAGARDAGATDGGAVADAGFTPIVFNASGCSTVGFEVLALVAWVMGFRKRSTPE